jgi:hypothetical protein
MNRNGLEALVTPEESILLLMDHQPFQFANLHSHEAHDLAARDRWGESDAWLAVLGEWQRDWARTFRRSPGFWSSMRRFRRRVGWEQQLREVSGGMNLDRVMSLGE